MPRNPFSKISKYFKRHFGSSRSTSTSSNVSVPATGSTSVPPPQPTTQSPRPSTPPPCTPSPAIESPPPLTSSTSQVLAAALPAPTFLSPHPLPHHVAKSPDPTASSLVTPSPPDLILRPPTPDPTLPSLQPLALHASTPQSGQSTNFAGAHGFNIYNPQFNDFSLVGSGIEKLLKHSMPDAFHNSAARYPPPMCHLGTRNDYIAKITDWALGNSDHHEPILWMRGPFGIGKSAVAQSCAEALHLQSKLAATLFFSRSNADRDDPRRVFTSIAYQVAALCEPFSNIIDARIRRDPAIATKSLSTQFEELLARPLSQVDITRSGIGGCVVIIDGLDECRGTPEQCEIIRVIATSVRDRTTPFRWFITSRPEDPIIRTMKAPTVSSVSLHLELPVSRKIDHEILLYLTDEFKRIRETHGLSMSWPSEGVFAIIVDRTAGLWIYVTTITRFITDENSLGPEDQLQIVLAFLKDVSNKVGPDSPLAEMDFFYTLIMQRVPHKIRTIVRKILLLDSVINRSTIAVASLLGLPEEQFRRSCASIQSVMELRGSSLRQMSLNFHHASFLDFMKDPKRSGELCICGNFLIEYRQEVLDLLCQVCSRSTGPSDIRFPSDPVVIGGRDRVRHYFNNLECFWRLCCVPNHPIDSRAAASFEKLQFRTMLQLMGQHSLYLTSLERQRLRDNLPSEFRGKIFRENKCPTPGCTNIENVWILGHGENETVASRGDYGGLMLKSNQDPLPGQCFCGSRIKRGGY